MTTNQMRREAAKRKLERQQQRRIERAKRRQRIALITAVAAVVVVVAGFVVATSFWGGDNPQDDTAAPAPTAGAPAPAPDAATCFTPTPDQPAAKPVPVPDGENPPATGTVAVDLETSAGSIPMTLNRAEAPCTVASFVGLATASYYDDTPCHRLTTGEGLKVLQCGDPTGAGTGGPGYTVKDEPPTGLAPAPGGQGAIYPRGTVAMAKTAAPNSGGSQFFLVYADSTLPPEYTVFGKVDAEGLATIDEVAAAGSDDSNSPGDGKPKKAVTIESVSVD